jgi:hypothetical protein
MRICDNWVSFTPSSHTRYWSQQGESLAALREALDLDSKGWVV